MNAETDQISDTRIARTCTYIFEHIDEDLRVDDLAHVAAFSKYHFHRVFTAHTGLGVAKFIQMARLKRASFQLAFEPGVKVIDIALQAKFDSPEAFARAFKRAFGQTPSTFRTAPDWPAWHAKYQFTVPRSPTVMNVDIIDFPETLIAYKSHHGSHERLMETVSTFIAWRKETGFSPIKTSKTFGIPYGDPETMPSEDFRFDVCGSIEREVPQNAYGVETGVIPGGRCARVLHKGSTDTIADTVYYLYRDWLAETGERCRDFPCYFRYLNFIHDVDECDLRTEVYLPLE